MRDDMEENTSNATRSPDASMQDASCEDESAPDARRGQDPPNAPVTSLEHIATIEKALDELLASAKDPYTQNLLQDSIGRVEPKFRELLCHIWKIDDISVQGVDPIVESMQYRPQAFAAASDRGQTFTTHTVQSLNEQVRTYRTQCATRSEIKHLSAQVDRARRQMIYVM
jgi:hypothetical protein